jgi:hypothetical protein
MLKLIRERGVEGAFDPETIRIMVAAYERSWTSLQSSGPPYSENDYAEGAREFISKYIIQATAAGDRDEQKLCDGALLALAQSDLRGRTAASTMPRTDGMSDRAPGC